MLTIPRFARAMQVRWAPSLILGLVLLLAPAAGAASVASRAAASHAASLTSSVGAPKDGCGGAGLPC